jgi:hypothetical protein
MSLPELDEPDPPSDDDDEDGRLNPAQPKSSGTVILHPLTEPFL